MTFLNHAHIGLDLTETRARAASWKDVGSTAARPFDGAHVLELVALAERGTLDFVLFDDDFTLQASRNTTLRGRLDPALIAARLGPRSRGIGLVASVGTRHTDPRDVAQAVASIDRASGGRAAWQLGGTDVDQGDDVAAAVASGGHRLDVAAEQVLRSWDRWDGAVPQPALAGRGSYVDVEGIHFAASARGATPPPPQGRPPIVVRLGAAGSLDVAARFADVVRIRATGRAEAQARTAQVLDAVAGAGRDPRDVRVLVDAFVVLAADEASARARLELVAELDGVAGDAASLVHAGTAEDLADLVGDWVESGAADGFTVRPASLRTDLHELVEHTVPALRAAGLFRDFYPGTTLRDTLGLAGQEALAVSA
ncbi:LLM class flavin-dependent oxidoreductase [Cellulomonas edaphi]|uniref:LLM class flavin-dependent oxidoreductase n=1 Tax=Cellulomonas edaphi TaxID=3053468 RepID=A0ABT7S2J5_9CELL|nr:LLM class flavin-dependent oxidoreductase [Cellulomons edaphi]MDM7829830.1 LLM class flavin-dependent oxidoreductase [Cellulomons edaphi]